MSSKNHQPNTIFLPMASHDHHTIQHIIFSFAFFLLQFSLLQFLSLGSYTLQPTYFINCGSDTNIKQNNNVYIAESDPNYLNKSFHKSYTESNPSSTSLSLYQSAKIFQTQSSYEFNTNPNNTYMLRFHFFSFSSPTNFSTAKFNLSVSTFSPLLTFDAKNTTNSNSPLVKEYLVKIIRSTFKITFTPQKSSFAFVNAIELFKLPLHLITDSTTRFNYTESTSEPLTPYIGGLLSRALETKLRLNVGCETVTRDTDNLSREWLPDDSYITYPENAMNFSFDGIIKFTADDDSYGPYSDNFIGPNDVYGTAKESIIMIL